MNYTYAEADGQLVLAKSERFLQIPSCLNGFHNTETSTAESRSGRAVIHFHGVMDLLAIGTYAIINCKSGRLGCNISECPDCGHVEFHNNSCRDRSCPNCQAVLKEVWVDKRSAEVIDVPYFHVVFTLPHELNPLIYCNQKLLYSLLHKCSAQTLLELSANKKYLGATPGIIQVLHTWNQELDYHVHVNCIVSGGGLTSDHKIRYYGFLNNRMKNKNLKLIFKLQGHQRFKQKYAGLSVADLLKAAWDYDICVCRECGCKNMRPLGRTFKGTG